MCGGALLGIISSRKLAFYNVIRCRRAWNRRLRSPLSRDDACARCTLGRPAVALRLVAMVAVGDEAPFTYAVSKLRSRSPVSGSSHHIMMFEAPLLRQRALRFPATDKLMQRRRTSPRRRRGCRGRCYDAQMAEGVTRVAPATSEHLRQLPAADRRFHPAPPASPATRDSIMALPRLSPPPRRTMVARHAEPAACAGFGATPSFAASSPFS